jgi:3-dehydroquinate synthase
MHTILPLKDYTIAIDTAWETLNEFLHQKSYSKYFVLVDEHTQVHCLPLLQKALPTISFIPIVVTSGEEHKNLDTCQYIWQQLLTHLADRNSLMINLGGGVIGDMGGFTASCYKRGIDFAMIPTTLLSQVDSSIGGKLGVDLAFGKNLIGVFANPKWVYINTQFLRSLPIRQHNNGWAEIYKHALIYDSELWEILTSSAIYDIAHAEKILPQALIVKKKVVEIDPFEKGLRKILNFGHTVGHAIESYSLSADVSPLLHGEAVFLGMILEAYISTQKSGLDISVVHQIITIYKKLYTPYVNLASVEMWMPYMYLDKKNVGDDIRCALLKSIGEAVWDISITQDDVAAAVSFYKQNL